MTTPSPSRIRIGRRYRANRPRGPYDAVVIGSGIGGLPGAQGDAFGEIAAALALLCTTVYIR